MANKNILMICYYFPPLTDVGCKRSVAFAKYLKKNNWNPFVLSVKNPDRHYCSLGNDLPPEGIFVEYSYSIVNPIKFLGRLNGILSRILGAFNIQIKRNYFYEFLCIPDFFVGWVPLSIVKALKIIKAYDIEYLYISCSPFSASLIGVVCRLLTGKKMILDYRDPYGLTMHEENRSKLKVVIDAFFMKFFLKYCDILIVTTDETRQEYIAQYPESELKIHTVHNGFDSHYLIKVPKKKFDKFTIIYTGQFYDRFNSSLHTFAKNFFSALKELKNEKSINSRNFQFLFYGSELNAIKDYSIKYEVEDLVSINERIGYSDVLQMMSRSHLQLLRIMKMMLSTKLFEGISLNVPFLATIPPGEAEQIIKMYSPSSYIVTEDSVDKVKYAIKDAMINYQRGMIYNNHVMRFMDDFSRENLTMKFIDKLEKHFECIGNDTDE